jgi:hypothetical protein
MKNIRIEAIQNKEKERYRRAIYSPSLIPLKKT